MKKVFIYIFAACTLGLASCSDYLDVTPSDKQTAAQLFGTKSGFYAAQNGVYDALSSDALYGKQMTWEAVDVISSSYVTSKASTYYKNLAANNYTEINVANALSSIWEKAYSTILAANVLIDQVEKQKGILSQPEAELMKGEMLAVRAYLHLDMMRLFGPSPLYGVDQNAVPYNESSNITVLPLLSIKEVGEKVIRDLDEAEKLLAKDPIIENGPMMSEPEDGSSVQNRYRQYRFNIYAVKALKARAYLWVGENEKAYKAATDLINDPKVQDMFPAVNKTKHLADASKADRVFSSEVFMGIYDKDRDNVYNNYFSSSAPTSQHLQPYSSFIAGGSRGLFTHLLLGPENDDYRFESQWEAASGSGAQGHTFCKYKKIDQPDETDENSEYYYAKMIPMIKMQEMYYIALEASKTVEEKFEWYNKARMRRGLADLSGSPYEAQLIMYWDYGYGPIFASNELRREYWGEGQWFYHIKRNAILLDSYGYEDPGFSYPTENGASTSVVSVNANLPLPVDEMK